MKFIKLIARKIGITPFLKKIDAKHNLRESNSDHCKYEFDRFLKYSTLGMSNNNPRYICTQLKIYIHIIEKGFSMKNPRLGFGKKKLLCIINWLNILEESGNSDFNKSVYNEALCVLNYYYKYSKENNLDASFIPQKYLSADIDITNIGVCKFTTKDMAELKNMNFYDFAHARHSFRYFKDIPLKKTDIENAVILAQTAPSACNRQSVKVYCINEKQKASTILDIQEGAKGFEGVNSVFLITSDLADYTYIKEYSAAYVDGALFMMNLLYSLNYYSIATCPLMFDDSENYGKKIRQFVNISQTEVIIGIIAAGYYEDTDMKTAFSKRKDLRDVLVID